MDLIKHHFEGNTHQSGKVGTCLSQPIVVAVSDSFDNPVSGEKLEFSFESIPWEATGQMLSDSVDTTDSTGRVSFSLKLGSRVGVYRVNAASTSKPALSITLNAAAVFGPAANFIIVSGNTQSVSPATVLPLPFVVKVTDSYSSPVSDVSIAFAVTATSPSATGQSP